MHIRKFTGSIATLILLPACSMRVGQTGGWAGSAMLIFMIAALLTAVFRD